MSARTERVGVECQNCHCQPEEQPMVFKNELWCSDDCRKELLKKGVLTAPDF